MPGVTIGIGAVIGCGAVLTKEVEPYSVVVEVPAKPIKKRFSTQQIKALLSIQWRDWDYETMKNRLSEFNDIDLFLEKSHSIYNVALNGVEHI